MWKTAHQHILKLVAYEPGKPVEELAREMGLAALGNHQAGVERKSARSIAKALAAMHEALERSHFYPDGGGWALRGAIAEKLGLDRENVILGNGSNEIIEFIGHAFLRPGDEVVTARHAFAVYTLMAQLFGAKDHRGARSRLSPTIWMRCLLRSIGGLARYSLQTRTIRRARWLDRQEIDRFMDRVPEEVLVIFDEAYYEFLDNPPDVLKYVREGRNVVVMRTFSKIQGLAGLRIGYGLASQGDRRSSAKDTPALQRQRHCAGGSDWREFRTKSICAERAS